MTEKIEDWENELWAYVNSGNGKNCPGSDSCQLIKNGQECFNNQAGKEKVRTIHKFVDNDFVDLANIATVPHLSECFKRNKIIELIRKLAQKYRNELWDGSLPVPDNLFTKTPDGVPIEVRYVSLKASHGALWRMNDAWLIYLNKDSPSSRQRFTLYHEIFHILAHDNGDPVFKKSEDNEVYFNEFLADHFSANILMPNDLVLAKWPEIKDVNKVAELFNVPASIICGKLRFQKLI